MASPGKVALITVGTTRFDALMREVDTAAFADAMRRLGVRRIVVQHGTGAYRPSMGEAAARGLEVETFALRDGFSDVIAAADVVIGHAGAGTILESLRADKKLVVVTNEALMDNHQAEIGEEMAARGHAVHTSVTGLVAALDPASLDALRPYPPADAAQFVRLLDAL